MSISVNYAKVLYELEVPYKMAEKSLSVFESDAGVTLMKVLCNPTIEEKEKYAVIDAVFTDEDYNRVFRNFLKNLCQSGHFNELPEIVAYYDAYEKEQRGIVLAKVYYALEIDETKKAEIHDYISRKYEGKEIEVRYYCKEELMGGFVIEVDGLEIDWSIKGRMNRMRNQLLRR